MHTLQRLTNLCITVLFGMAEPLRLNCRCISLPTKADHVTQHLGLFTELFISVECFCTFQKGFRTADIRGEVDRCPCRGGVSLHRCHRLDGWCGRTGRGQDCQKR